jgi:hypothetical protein
MKNLRNRMFLCLPDPVRNADPAPDTCIKKQINEKP